MTEQRRATLRGVIAQPTQDDDALTFTASSTGLNRYGFALRHDGWQIDNFNANPVVLWMHLDHMPPIGRARAVMGAGQLSAAVTFDRSDPFATAIEQKYRGGFLNAVSVGFDFVDQAGKPLENWWRLSAEQINKQAFYDLAEISAVPVPADPKALVASRGRLAAGLMDDLWHDPAEDMSGLVTALGAPEGWAPDREQGTPPIVAPVLPGNSQTEREVAALRTEFTALAARLDAVAPPVVDETPAGEPPAGEQEPELSTESVESLLAAASLAL